MTKEVWIVVGRVTEPDSPFYGEVEYQFSDSPPGERGSSADYVNLAKGLREHSGSIMHWVGEMKTYTVEVTVHERRCLDGTVKVVAPNADEARRMVLEGKFDDFREDGNTCEDWGITEVRDAFKARL